MDKINRSITGGSLLLSGSLIFNLVMSKVDWVRIDNFGLIKVLCEIDISLVIFFMSILMMFFGILILIYNFFVNQKEK